MHTEDKTLRDGVSHFQAFPVSDREYSAYAVDLDAQVVLTADEIREFVVEYKKNKGERFGVVQSRKLTWETWRGQRKLTSREQFAQAVEIERETQGRYSKWRGISGAPLRPYQRFDFTGADFSNLDFSGMRFVKEFKFRGVNFNGCDFSKAHLGGCAAWDATFRGATFHEARLSSCDMRDSDFTEASFREAVIEGGCYNGSIFRRADCSNSLWGKTTSSLDAYGADFRQAVFRGSTLFSLRFSGANLRDCDLRDTKLSSITFDGTDLRGADFTDSIQSDLTLYSLGRGGALIEGAAGILLETRSHWARERQGLEHCIGTQRG